MVYFSTIQNAAVVLEHTPPDQRAAALRAIAVLGFVRTKLMTLWWVGYVDAQRPGARWGVVHQKSVLGARSGSHSATGVPWCASGAVDWSNIRSRVRIVALGEEGADRTASARALSAVLCDSARGTLAHSKASMVWSRMSCRTIQGARCSGSRKAAMALQPNTRAYGRCLYCHATGMWVVDTPGCICMHAFGPRVW
jgi:hypothetical protein